MFIASKTKTKIKNRIITLITAIMLLISMMSLTIFVVAEELDYSQAEALAERTSISEPVSEPEVEIILEPESETEQSNTGESLDESSYSENGHTAEEASNCDGTQGSSSNDVYNHIDYSEYDEEGDEEYGIANILYADEFSLHTPYGLTTTHIVSTEAGLRDALASTANPLVVRLENGFNFTGAFFPVTTGPATREVHLYSDTYDAFSITRTGGAGRHFNVTGSRQLHLYNVTLTRPGPNLTTSSGGVFVGDNGHLHLHAGSTISNNRANLGPAVYLSSAGGVSRLTMHDGSVIRNNHSTAGVGGGGGGGVLVSSSAVFTMLGGEIKYNTAANTGGGVQVAQHGGGATRARFYMSGGVIRDNRSTSSGGGVHLNTNGEFHMSGYSLIYNNSAGGGGGGAIRIYRVNAGSAGAFSEVTISGNARIIGNSTNVTGGAISVAGSGPQNHSITISENALISGNTAGGNGGAIFISQALVGSGQQGRLTINGGSIVNNTANNGGAIWVNMAAANFPTTPAVLPNPSARISISEEVRFEGNVARNGILIDELLAQSNDSVIPGLPVRDTVSVDHDYWIGVNPATGVGERRAHLFNNNDLNIRNGIAIRPVKFEVLGTARDDSELTAFVTRVARAGTGVGNFVDADIEIYSGTPVPVRTEAAQTSQVRHEVAYYPWNTTNPWHAGPAGTPDRNWRTGEADAAGTIISNPSSVLPTRNIPLIANNLIAYQTTVEIYYIYHDITFNVSPTIGATLIEGEQRGTSITRTLRESRSGGTFEDGAPIGTPPIIEKTAGWIFLNWTHNGAIVSTDRYAPEIANMPVTGPMTFTANFVPGLTLENVPSGLTHTNQTGATTDGSLMFDGDVNPVTAGTFVVLSAGTVPESHYFLGWYRGTEAPPIGTYVQTLDQNNFTALSFHTFIMPYEGLQYFALWGARNIVGAYEAQITFHAYGEGRFATVEDDLWSCEDGTYIVIPIAFDRPIDLRRVVTYIDGIDDVGAFAFWGWFTDARLDYSNRTRGNYRRPIVGESGWDQIRVTIPATGAQVSAGPFSRTQFADFAGGADAYNFDLYAIWSLWGDVDDNDRVDIDDIDSMRRNIIGLVPRLPMNAAPGDVYRDEVLDIDDIDTLRRNVIGLIPRPVMGQRPGTRATPVTAVLATTAFVEELISETRVDIPAVWSISYEEIPANAEYVDVRVRLDQIPTGGLYGDGISAAVFGFHYDSRFLGNPRRVGNVSDFDF
ncbi:MAG: hypothetical protein FWD05_05535, partial [Oscillospiraceae bacterium]|nr:hypothetical protein [Oscillospiraceae bacterium]